MRIRDILLPREPGRTFWSIGAGIALLTVALALMLLALTVTRELNTARMAKEAAYTESFRILTEDIAEVTDDLRHTRRALEGLRWYRSLYTEADVFDASVDALRRMEAVEQMALLCSENGTFPSAHGSLESVALVFPSYEDGRNQGFVVSSREWVDLDTWMRTYFWAEDSRTVTDACENGDIENTTLSALLKTEGLVFVWPMDNSNKPVAYLVVTFNRNVYAQALLRKMPEDAVRLTITRADGSEVLPTLIRNQAQTESVLTKELMSSAEPSLDWTLTCAYDRGRVNISVDALARLPRELAIYLLVGLMFSYILARVTYRPLDKLLQKLRQRDKNHTVSAYDAIEDELKELTDMLEQLGREKEQIAALCSEMEKAREIQALRGLLDGVFDSNETELYNSLGFTEGNRYRVALIKPAHEEDDEREAVALLATEKLLSTQAESERKQPQIVKTDDGFAAILCSDENVSEQLLTMSLRKVWGEGAEIAIGEERGGLLGISKSRNAARQTLNDGTHGAQQRNVSEQESASYYYPQEWELQLASALRDDHTDTALRIIRELRRENERRATSSKQEAVLLEIIWERIVRTVNSGDMGVTVDATQYGSWEGLENACRSIHKANAEQCKNALNMRIVQYVDEHYMDSTLSLTVLEQEFSLSAPFINRAFRMVCGTTFYQYLMRVRCEKAQKLLWDGVSFAETARRVGYENVSSFRRVFERYEQR